MPSMIKPPNHSKPQLNLPRECYTREKVRKKTVEERQLHYHKSIGKKSGKNDGGKTITVSLEYLLKSKISP